jgi:Transposase
MKIEELIEELQEAQDSRQEWKIQHKIGDIIAITIIGTLAGCDEWKQIYLFSTFHEKTLREYLELPNGLPSSDTIRRVMAIVDPGFLQKMRDKWNELLSKGEGEKLRKILAIDGKTQCGNGNVNQAPNHIVSVVDEEGVCIGERVVDDKSNEITAIPELLKKLKIKGQIITIDAMGTQREIASQIRKQKADYVLSLKRNQCSLYDDIAMYFSDDDFVKKCEYSKKVEKARGGIEQREYWQTDDILWLSQRAKWTGLKTIGMSRNTINRNNKTTIQTRYFISSLEKDVNELARCIRGHWIVESFHWHLDVTFCEDANQTLEKQAAFNLNILRKFALHILKVADIGDKYTSIKNKRMYIAHDPIRYLKLVFNL